MLVLFFAGFETNAILLLNIPLEMFMKMQSQIIIVQCKSMQPSTEDDCVLFVYRR